MIAALQGFRCKFRAARYRRHGFGEMTENERGAPLLRDDGDGDHRVTPMELFFDLVYVFAITQLSHLLVDHLDARGVLQTGLLLIAVWVAWIYTTWMTNWLDPNRRPVRCARPVSESAPAAPNAGAAAAPSSAPAPTRLSRRVSRMISPLPMIALTW